MARKDVLRIVCDYLVDHGYDGLCNTDEGCGCQLIDLVPCDCGSTECVPAYSHPDLAKKNKCGFWMTPRKPRGKK